uniref:Stealth_CR2 domain-containing protein n=1 Tax=Macrostomum lignano TaxID=282301 RepID=A0A1I8JMU2_9PLAT
SAQCAQESQFNASNLHLFTAGLQLTRTIQKVQFTESAGNINSTASQIETVSAASFKLPAGNCGCCRQGGAVLLRSNLSLKTDVGNSGESLFYTFENPDKIPLFELPFAVAFEVTASVRNGRLRRLFGDVGRRRGLPQRLEMLLHQPRRRLAVAHFDSEQDKKNTMKTALELKYSLRSLTKFAPWIRKVYLVTNGQVPNWLNLTNPRLTLITHECIRTTFIAPASGYRIYQSWEVPNCAAGCPHAWVSDGSCRLCFSCDLPCNNSHCDFDGGDCLNAQLPVGRWLMPNLANLAAAGQLRLAGAGSADLCAPGCLNGWLADGFCDRVCDRPECGHDSGDCGMEQLTVLTPAAHSGDNDTT